MSPEAIVQRQLDAYNRHDLAAFVATYAEDAELYRVPATTPALKGRQALGEFYRDHRFNLPALHAELVHRTVLGDKVIDHERITGLGDGVVEAVAAYVVRDGLIRSAWMFAPQ
ncbi:nuclear transport factor 2 family protein [Ideonella sp.]|uniref:nuclear transport factor 2 family protein n=1 Tax=Ideonella sp. TaxID=1929293 RepID=UPI0035ADD970